MTPAMPRTIETKRFGATAFTIIPTGKFPKECKKEGRIDYTLTKNHVEKHTGMRICASDNNYNIEKLLGSMDLITYKYIEYIKDVNPSKVKEGTIVWLRPFKR